MPGIVPNHIFPTINLDGQAQSLRFDKHQSLTQLQIENIYIPNPNNPSQNCLEFLNSKSSGYRFKHITSYLNSYGTLILESFVNSQIPATTFLAFNEAGPIVLSPPTSQAVQLKNGLSAVPLQFFNASGNFYAGLQAGSLISNVTWTLPTADSSGTQALVSNGAGSLSFSDYYSPGNPTTLIDDFTDNVNPLLAYGNLGVGTKVLNSLVLESPANTYNLAIGSQALLSFTTGAVNTAVGMLSLLSLVTGNYNSSFGPNLISLTSGENNSVYGAASANAMTTGSNNCFFGNHIGIGLSSLNDCCFFGSQAGTVINDISGSIAFGRFASVNANQATAIGFDARADANATSVGSDSNANGDFSIAIGSSSQCSGNGSIAIGSNSDTFSANSIAIGFDANAIGDNSISIGANSNANSTGGTDAVAIGANAAAQGTNSIAIGKDVVVTADNSVALGNSCNVGIGTFSPAYRLDVVGTGGISINANAGRIIDVATPTVGTDAANKAYVDSKSTSIGDAKFIIQTADADLPNAQILGSLATGLLKNTTTTGVLSIAVSGTDYATLANRLDQFAVPTASLNLNSQKIINLLNPTNAQDAATKSYVDSKSTAIGDAKFIIQTADADLPNAQILGALATGLLKNTTTTGVLSIATAGTDYYSLNNPTKLIDGGLGGNVSVGKTALNSIALGVDNIIVGNSGASITNGNRNCIISNTAMGITTGSNNIIVGNLVSTSLNGNDNIILGTTAGDTLTTANNNIFIGSGSGHDHLTGNSNIGIGTNAGSFLSGTTTYGSCIFIGDNATLTVANLTNAIAIGVGATVSTSNSMVLGNSLNVGIGTSSPTTAKLVISGGVTTVASEFSVIRATGNNNATKIEIERSGGSGKLYELRSDDAGAFSIFDRTAVVSRMFINTSGNIGLNMTSSILAKLHVTGGFQNIANEDTGIRVTSSSNSAKIELQCTNGSGKLYELHSDNNGGYHIYDRTANASRMFINASGLVGINTFSSTVAQLIVNGGVINVASEESCIRAISSSNVAKIEIQCTNGSGRIYEFRSGNNGAFDIVDRTAVASRLLINTSGQVGIGGVTAPHAQLQLPSVVTNRQLVLYEAANNDFQFHGFGSIAGGLGYNINDVGDSHVFFAGVNTTTRNELARFTGAGDCRIAGSFYGRTPSGTCYMQANATATAVTGGNWTKIAGTTSSSLLNVFSMPANNRLQYTGTPTITAYIVASVTAYHDVGAGSLLGFSLFKNGVQVVPSAAFHHSALSIVSNTCVITIVSLATNDYIEVYGISSANANITVSNLTFNITTT